MHQILKHSHYYLLQIYEWEFHYGGTYPVFARLSTPSSSWNTEASVMKFGVFNALWYDGMIEVLRRSAS